MLLLTYPVECTLSSRNQERPRKNSKGRSQHDSENGPQPVRAAHGQIGIGYDWIHDQCIVCSDNLACHGSKSHHSGEELHGLLDLLDARSLGEKMVSECVVWKKDVRKSVVLRSKGWS